MLERVYPVENRPVKDVKSWPVMSGRVPQEKVESRDWLDREEDGEMVSLFFDSNLCPVLNNVFREDRDVLGFPSRGIIVHPLITMI